MYKSQQASRDGWSADLCTASSPQRERWQLSLEEKLLAGCRLSRMSSGALTVFSEGHGLKQQVFTASQEQRLGQVCPLERTPRFGDLRCRMPEISCSMLHASMFFVSFRGSALLSQPWSADLCSSRRPGTCFAVTTITIILILFFFF